MLNNLSCSLIKHGRITTTVAKAKVLRPYIEKLITKGKSGTLHNRRILISKLKNSDSVNDLISNISPNFKDRNGGYTRIIKSGFRSGDAADMAIIEFVEEKNG